MALESQPLSRKSLVRLVGPFMFSFHVENAIATAIVAALGGPRPESFLRRVWENWGLVSTMNLLSFQEPRLIGEFTADKPTNTPLAIALMPFDRAAARFKAEHKRPAVLVLDNIDTTRKHAPTYYTYSNSMQRQLRTRSFTRSLYVQTVLLHVCCGAS